MSKASKSKIVAEVLGAVNKPQATGGYIVDLETVSAPLVCNKTVIRACCLGCGYCLEILGTGAEHLIKLAGLQKPKSWKGYYFEAQRCPICDKDYSKVALKKISDLQ